MDLITDTDALAAFCARQKGAQFVAIDTEFMRERTYWPILCVVQVAGKVRGRLEVPVDIGDEELTRLAMRSPGAWQALSGRPVRRVIVRAPRLVNLVPAE